MKKLFRVRKWKKHIIEKFGDKLAKQFAWSGTTCPCLSSNWVCNRCNFKPLDGSCRDSRLWTHELNIHDVRKIQSKLREIYYKND